MDPFRVLKAHPQVLRLPSCAIRASASSPSSRLAGTAQCVLPNGTAVLNALASIHLVQKRKRKTNKSYGDVLRIPQPSCVRHVRAHPRPHYLLVAQCALPSRTLLSMPGYRFIDALITLNRRVPTSEPAILHSPLHSRCILQRWQLHTGDPQCDSSQPTLFRFYI